MKIHAHSRCFRLATLLTAVSLSVGAGEATSSVALSGSPAKSLASNATTRGKRAKLRCKGIKPAKDKFYDLQPTQMRVLVSATKGAKLTYEWSATKGRFQGAGSEVTYTGGVGTYGQVTINVTVRDEHGGQCSCLTEVLVISGE